MFVCLLKGLHPPRSGNHSPQSVGLWPARNDLTPYHEENKEKKNIENKLSCKKDNVFGSVLLYGHQYRTSQSVSFIKVHFSYLPRKQIFSYSSNLMSSYFPSCSYLAHQVFSHLMHLIPFYSYSSHFSSCTNVFYLASSYLKSPYSARLSFWLNSSILFLLSVFSSHLGRSIWFLFI